MMKIINSIINKTITGIFLSLLLLSTINIAHAARLQIVNNHYLEYNDNQVALFGMGNFWALSDPGVDYVDMITSYKNDGSNYMRMSLLGHTVAKRAGLAPTSIIHPFARSSTPGAIDGGNKFDLNTFNNAYFQRLKNLITHAESKQVFIMFIIWDEIPLEAGAARWEYNPFNPNNNINSLGLPSSSSVNAFYQLGNTKLLAVQEAFLKKVLDTVSAHGNVFFTISNEYTGSDTWHKYWFDYIKNYSVSKSINSILVNELEWSGFSPSYTNFISLETTQNGGSRNWKSRPVVNHRTGPKMDSVLDNARKAWWSVFMNGGHTSDDSHDGGDAPNHHNSTAVLKARQQIKIFRSFIETLPYNQMVPAFQVSSSLVSAGEGRVKPGENYVIYLKSGGSTTVDLTAASGSLTVDWYNPRTGINFSTTTTSGGATKTFAAPGGNDWVLHIYSATSSPPAPAPTPTSDATPSPPTSLTVF